MQEWISEYKEMKQMSSTEQSSPEPHDVMTKFEKVKHIFRKCALYFIDWVIE